MCSALPDYEEQFRAWGVVIRELEADLARIEADDDALDGRLISADWSPPTVGPLPPEYASTVVRLIDAQRVALERLASRQRTVGDHLGAVRAAGSTQEPTGARYLDREG